MFDMFVNAFVLDGLHNGTPRCALIGFGGRAIWFALLHCDPIWDGHAKCCLSKKWRMQCQCVCLS